MGVMAAETTGAPAGDNQRLGVPAGQDPGTRDMIERLTRLRETPELRYSVFQADQLAAVARRTLERTTNGQQEVQLRFQLGKQLLNAGDPNAALEQFRQVEEKVASIGGKLGSRGRVDLLMSKATALMRLGELENCQINHTAQSCLFPIERGGVHTLPRGSRGAIALFEEHLREFPDDVGSRWLLNIAYMTLGEWPDRVPPQWVIPPSVFASEYPLPRFPDVAGAVGLDVEDLAGGCIVDDFDNDGFLDLFASSWGQEGQLRYFHNDGNGRFSERTKDAGLVGLFGGLNIQQTDYNNDGLLDVWVLRGAWLGTAGRIPNSLLKNNGDGTFSDVTLASGLFSQHPTQASVWFDFDGDGWLDVFIGNETSDREDPDLCELYHNNRDGTFTECAGRMGIRVGRFVKGVTSADYDHDGRPDLYLSCQDGPNLLFHNDGSRTGGSDPLGSWRFSEVSRQAGVSDRVISFPTWFFDYDNDGWEDLFVSGYSIRGVSDVASDYLNLPHEAALPKLYHNNGDGTFTDVTVATHLNRVCHAMGANFGDLDNDGWLDLYLATGNPDLTTLIPNRMFRNADGKFFQEVTTAGGFGHLQKGHGVAFADLDNDGDQDVYVVMGGAFPGDRFRNALFLNPGNNHRWVKLKLEGTKSNRAAIGARIRVNITTADGPRHIFKTVNSGGSFGSSPLRQEIGLADATGITDVEIVWPSSGIRQVITGLAPGGTYRIREGDDQAVALPSPALKLDLQNERAHQPSVQAGL